MSALWGASRGTGAPGKGQGPSPAGALYGFSVKSVGEADTTHTQDTEATGKADTGLGTGRGAWKVTSADRVQLLGTGLRAPAVLPRPPRQGRNGSR